MKQRLPLILLGLLTVAGHVLAQSPEMTDAEIRKIDRVAGKVTLQHGEIKNLDMPPMTMVFQVKDPAMLIPFKAGDKVRFTADKVNGAYTVRTLTPLK